jgi:hypothetical protein
VFSIRPVLALFQGREIPLDARRRRAGRFQQILVSNCEKDRYNLAKRAAGAFAPGEMATICKHPKVRVVSRHEDTEYVECLECGEVFDSEEFRDMEIEETTEKEDVADD